MNPVLAPICIFVYNRPVHSEKMLNSLVANQLFSESEVFVFADGPKDGASPEEIEKIKQVRDKLKILENNKAVHYNLSEENKGLTKSIVSGITDIINKYGKVIVIEDDLELSPGFLKYMNDALNLYESEERVMHIGGYMVPHKINLPETFFLKTPTIWGWGTWKRAWGNYEINAVILLENLEAKFGKDFAYAFDVNGTYTYTKQLRDIASGKLDTWDIQWAASIYLENGLCLHPGLSLTINNGFDGSGVHCSFVETFNNQIFAKEISVFNQLLLPNKRGMKAFSAHHKKNYHPKKKELIVKYFYKLTNYIPKDLRKILKKIINYSHLNLTKTVD